MIWYDEYEDDEILQGFHEDQERLAESYIEFDEAEVWLAAQDVPDWTATESE